ncbi:hypothetical protein NQZ68_032075 [Dissostichus eleginoides]|nr:hypothetical protein NQZ68_032075 [Dissostichus eleginoides]
MTPLLIPQMSAFLHPSNAIPISYQPIPEQSPAACSTLRQPQLPLKSLPFPKSSATDDARLTTTMVKQQDLTVNFTGGIH